MKQTKILIPLPSYGFDPTEVAIPWKILSKNNFNIVFATPNGKIAAADELMLKGRKLGIWKPFLKARKDAVEAYSQMEKEDDFHNPLTYGELKEKDFDALLLPGGHHKGVREYLESKLLQDLVVEFFNSQKPVGAICHGVVLASRSINPKTGKSVLYNLKTTALLKSQELLAFNLTRLWLNDYYLTYPELTVEDEVRASLSNPDNFLKGPIPLMRDNPTKLDKGFAVKSGNYVSARWPGDAYTFANKFMNNIIK